MVVDAAMAPLQFAVHGNLAVAMMNADDLVADGDTDLFADQLPGYRIDTAVDRDRDPVLSAIGRSIRPPIAGCGR